MGDRCKNMGAAWTRSDGTRVERGEVFTPLPGELRYRRYKVRAVSKEAPPNAARTEQPKPDLDDLSRYDTGNGWYSLPGGVRVHGEEAAASWLLGG